MAGSRPGFAQRHRHARRRRGHREKHSGPLAGRKGLQQRAESGLAGCRSRSDESGNSRHAERRHSGRGVFRRSGAVSLLRRKHFTAGTYAPGSHGIVQTARSRAIRRRRSYLHRHLRADCGRVRRQCPEGVGSRASGSDHYCRTAARTGTRTSAVTMAA